MKNNLKTLLVLPFILLLNFSQPAHASLGSDESSIDKDSRFLKSSHQKSQVAGQTYTVHELKTSVLTVREYLSTNPAHITRDSVIPCQSIKGRRPSFRWDADHFYPDCGFQTCDGSSARSRPSRGRSRENPCRAGDRAL